MTVDVEVRRRIGRPVAEVASYAGDPGNAPTWYANIVSVQWQTPPPVGVGSRMTFVARFLGRRLEYTYEVLEHTSARLVMATAEGPFPMRTTYTWEADGDGTLMTLRNTGEPSGFAKVTAPVMELAMRRAMGKDLARLANVLGG